MTCSAEQNLAAELRRQACPPPCGRELEQQMGSRHCQQLSSSWGMPFADKGHLYSVQSVVRAAQQ